MTNPYTPHPGTIAARALAHLQAQPPGTELASAVLADALDIDSASVIPCLAAAISHGVLANTKRMGLLYWRLGTGQPVTLQDRDADAPIQRTIPATAAPKPKALQAPQPAPAPPGPTAPRRTTPKPASTAVAIAIAQPIRTTLRLAVWSDGSLAIERGSEHMHFTVDESRQIVRYLERMAESEGSAAA